MKRSKKTIQKIFVIDEGLCNQLVQYAQKTGKSQARIIRDSLDEYLNKHAPKSRREAPPKGSLIYELTKQTLWSEDQYADADSGEF